MSPVFYLLPRSPGEEPEPRGSICSSILSVCTFLPCTVQSQILLSLHVPALPVPILSHAETAISVDHWILWSKVLETGMLVDCLSGQVFYDRQPEIILSSSKEKYFFIQSKISNTVAEVYNTRLAKRKENFKIKSKQSHHSVFPPSCLILCLPAKQSLNNIKSTCPMSQSWCTNSILNIYS